VFDPQKPHCRLRSWVHSGYLISHFLAFFLVGTIFERGVLGGGGMRDLASEGVECGVISIPLAMERVLKHQYKKYTCLSSSIPTSSSG
jgi:hypothetical protein